MMTAGNFFSIRFSVLLIMALALGSIFSGTFETASHVAEAAFPGANGKIALTSNRDFLDDIHVMNTDGTGRINLTPSTSQEGAPDWSPDGT